MKITEKRRLLAEAKKFSPYPNIPTEDIKMFKKNGAYYGVAFGHSAFIHWNSLIPSLERWKRDHHTKAIQLLAELKKIHLWSTTSLYWKDWRLKGGE